MKHLLFLLLTALTLTACGNGKNKKDFAPQLAKDIVETWRENGKRQQGEKTFFSELNYGDIGRGISLHKGGMNLSDLIDGRAEAIGKGFDTGISMGGIIDLHNYDTGFGKFENQKLGFDQTFGNGLVLYHVKGILTNNKHPTDEPLQVDYEFQIVNNGPMNTLKMLSGQIKDGDEVIEVK